MKKALPAASCCLPFLQGLLGKDEAEQLADAFKAIADPARLRLLSFIASQPSAEACVCYLTEPLGLSQPTVSHHLKVLYDSGLLEREKRGTWVWYRIVPGRMSELRDALAPPAIPSNVAAGAHGATSAVSAGAAGARAAKTAATKTGAHR